MFAYAKLEQKNATKSTVQKKEAKKPVASLNLTGIPGTMKSRFKNLSRFSFDELEREEDNVSQIKEKVLPESSPVIQCRIHEDYDAFVTTMGQPVMNRAAIPRDLAPPHTSAPSKFERLYVNHVLLPEYEFINIYFNEICNRLGAKIVGIDRSLVIVRNRLGGVIDNFNRHLSFEDDSRVYISYVKNYMDNLWTVAPKQMKELECSYGTHVNKIDKNDRPDTTKQKSSASSLFEAKRDDATPELTQEQKEGNAYVESIQKITVNEFCDFFKLDQEIQLMFDIYYQWRSNHGTLDRRHPDPEHPDVPLINITTGNTPGAIRSFHGDQQNRLPPQDAIIDNVPVQTATFNAYMLQNANAEEGRKSLQKPYLAEYTGFSAKDEDQPHENKLVFDYSSGKMYVTFNHYKLMFEVDMTTF